jgi:hypothetical protein
MLRTQFKKAIIILDYVRACVTGELLPVKNAP